MDAVAYRSFITVLSFGAMLLLSARKRDARTNSRRVITLIIPLLAIGGIAFSHAQGGNKALVGSWYPISYASKPVPASQAVRRADFVLQQGGRYTVAGVRESGTWSVKGTTVILHKEKLLGKTKSQRLAELTQKYAKEGADESRMAKMRKGVNQIFADWKFTLSSDSKTLTLVQYGTAIIYRKRTD